jgi:hypothetical protein
VYADVGSSHDASWSGRATRSSGISLTTMVSSRRRSDSRTSGCACRVPCSRATSRTPSSASAWSAITAGTGSAPARRTSARAATSRTIAASSARSPSSCAVTRALGSAIRSSALAATARRAGAPPHRGLQLALGRGQDRAKPVAPPGVTRPADQPFLDRDPELTERVRGGDGHAIVRVHQARDQVVEIGTQTLDQVVQERGRVPRSGPGVELAMRIGDRFIDEEECGLRVFRSQRDDEPVEHRIAHAPES